MYQAYRDDDPRRYRLLAYFSKIDTYLLVAWQIAHTKTLQTLHFASILGSHRRDIQKPLIYFFM